MEDHIEKLRRQSLSKDLPEAVEGVDQLVNLIGMSADALLNALEAADNKFIVTERMSLAFQNYIKRLNALLEEKESDMSFWCATLMVHHGINSEKAEDILLDSVKRNYPDKKYVATTILVRKRNKKIGEVISGRLGSTTLSEMERRYFEEKLFDLNQDR